MNLLKIDILNDGTAICERQIAGQMGEGNITRLKFTVPYIYKEYYKYLDILKGNGEKTQTVIGDAESEVFYYNLPHSLTDCRELFIQLVMKKEDKIFKSKMIALHFDGGISGTQYLEENFQDTIEYLMENKADIKDLKGVESKLLLKAGKSELYELNESLTEKMNDHQEKNGIRLEGLEVITESLREKKVDKIYGKGLSSNDYTDEDKNKLASLPTNAELQREFETKVDKTTYERDKVEIEETISSYGHRIGMNEDNIVALEDMINENTDEIRNYINAQTEILETDVEGLKKQMQEESHFRGYISTNAKIKLLEATPNDFVYSAESGTKWIYDEVEGWKDTGLEVPDQLTPASETTPLIDGTASAGSENAYARGDHRHPTDTTRASAQEFNSLKEEYHIDVPWLITKYDNLTMRVREVEISVQEIEENMSSALDELHNYAQALISGGVS